MLMQLIAWVLGAPLVVLTLVYTTIFTAMLAAKFRQVYCRSEPAANAFPIRDLRGAYRKQA